MSKLSSIDLFYLIKSMTKSEKRHFKVYASKHISSEETNYIRLFDAIEKQDKYDEKELKKEKYIKQLPLLKTRLYDVILKRLAIFHSEHSVLTKVKNSIRHIELLYEKSLYSQCMILVVKQKEIAAKYECYIQLLELLFWENKLLNAQYYLDKKEKDLENIYNEINDVTNKINNLNDYQFIFSKMMMQHTRQGFARSQKEIDYYDNEMKHPLMEDINHALSYHAKHIFYSNYGSYHFIKDDIADAYEVAIKKIKLMESYPLQIKENVEHYISLLYSMIICQFKLKKYKDAANTIEKIRAIKISSKRIQAKTFYLAVNLELTLCINVGDFEKGVKIAETLQEHLEQKKMPFGKEREMMMYYEMACIYFGAENFSMANRYLNKIISSNLEENLRTDIYCYSKMLLLLIYYERKEMHFLLHQFASTHNYLYKKQRLYEFETALLNFIKTNLLRMENQKDMIPAFQALKAEIERTVKNPYDKKIFDYFDFISWIDSKIENRSFAEIVKEKALQSSIK